MSTPKFATTASQVTPSVIRTFVPSIVGSVITWLAIHLGLPLDQIAKPESPAFTFVVGAVTAVFTAIYYAGGRFLEVSVNEKWGYILGLKKKPVYTEGTVATVTNTAGQTTVVTPEADAEEVPDDELRLNPAHGDEDEDPLEHVGEDVEAFFESHAEEGK